MVKYIGLLLIFSCQGMLQQQAPSALAFPQIPELPHLPSYTQLSDIDCNNLEKFYREYDIYVKDMDALMEVYYGR